MGRVSARPNGPGLIVLCLGALCGCTGCVSGLFYYPDRTTYQTPARHGLRYEEVWFGSGNRLNGWFVPAVTEPSGTVVHFHGNAQNMTSHFDYVRWLPREGFSLFVFDYRGYGRSPGKPERSGIVEDCVAAIEYVRARPGVDPDRLLILGQSLGGAMALAALASRGTEGVRAIVIDSTFYSYRAIVRDKISQMPILSLLKWPLSLVLIGNSHSPAHTIGRVAPVPLLLIHGTHDRVIPCRHGERLFERARDPKQLWLVNGGAHTDALLRRACRRVVVEFFRRGCHAKAM